LAVNSASAWRSLPRPGLPTSRARATSYVALGWQSGVLCAALVTPLLLPYIGWRRHVSGRRRAGHLRIWRYGTISDEPAMFVEASKRQRINPYGVLIRRP